MSSENNRKLVKYGLPLSSAIKKEESSGSDCSRRVSHIQSTFKNVAVGLSDDALRKATSKSDLKIIEKSPFIWNRRELVYKPVGQDTSLVLVKGTKESPTEESIPNSLYWQTDPVDAIQNIDIKTAKLLEETEEKLRLDFMKEVK